MDFASWLRLQWFRYVVKLKSFRFYLWTSRCSEGCFSTPPYILIHLFPRAYNMTLPLSLRDEFRLSNWNTLVISLFYDTVYIISKSIFKVHMYILYWLLFLILWVMLWIVINIYYLLIIIVYMLYIFIFSFSPRDLSPHQLYLFLELIWAYFLIAHTQ